MVRSASSSNRTQHVDRAVDADFGDRYGIELIVNRRSWTVEIEDCVNLDKQRSGHVMTHRLEHRISEKMSNVWRDGRQNSAGQPFTEKRAEKPDPTFTRIRFPPTELR